MNRGAAVLVLVALGALVAPGTPAALEGQQTATTFSFAAPDPGLQAGLDSLLRRSPYRRLTQQGRLSVALVDLTDPRRIRYAGFDDNHMRYAASLPKIAILLGVFDQIEKGQLEYTPQLRRQMEQMIRRSDNAISSQLIRLVGFQNIAATLQDPRHELYDLDRSGGLWVGKGYGGLGVWRRDPLSSISHGATARQVARFMTMMQLGRLVSPWASAEMKDIMADPQIHHKFVRGLETNRPGSTIFRKSGSWQSYHADAAIVERDGRRYAAVVLFESATTSSGGVLASLIVRLDDLIFAS